MKRQSANVVRTIRANDEDITGLLDELDGRGSDAADNLRNDSRYRFRLKGCVVHLQSATDGMPTSYLVTTRNLSNSGLCFLHGTYLYAGTKCVTQLTSIHGAWQNVPAVVRRCAYLRDGIHEIGVQFITPIEASEFCVEATTCRVLVVDDNPAIIRFSEVVLSKLNAEVASAGDGRTAVELAQSSFYDVILMDIDMPVMTGDEAVRALRAQGYSGQVVAVTGMTGPGDREKCLEAGFNDYVAKPFTKEDLAQLLLSIRQEPIHSSLSNDASVAPLIDGFVQQIPGRVREIETQFASFDIQALQRSTRNLKADAGCFGFDLIAEAAAKVEAALVGGKSKEAVKGGFEGLVQLCRQVRCRSTM